MKTNRTIAGWLVLLALSTLNLQPTTAFAQGTAFTYQGRLNVNGSPANNIYDLRFTIYDSASGGSVVSAPLTNSATAITNGLFTVTLNPGPGVFTGADRWLEIGMCTNGGGAFATLTPRQAITPTPYAVFANSASNLNGTLPPSQLGAGTAGISISGNAATATTANSASSVSATNISGTIPDARLSSNVALLNASQTFSGVNSFVNAGNSFTGNGYWLTSLNANNLGNGTVSPARGGTGLDTSAASANSLLRTTATGTWGLLGPGSMGQVLRVIGGGQIGWGADQNSGGTVTYVGTGTGLSGGPITSSGTLSIDTAVVPTLSAANTFSLGPQTILSGSAGNRGVIVRATASQTANLQEWQNSVGTPLAAVSASGGVAASSFSGDGSGLTSLSANAIVGGLTTNLAVLVPGGGTNTLCFTNGVLRAVQ